MGKFITLGVKASGEETLVAGSDTPLKEQVGMVIDARNGSFPKGIVSLYIVPLSPFKQATGGKDVTPPKKTRKAKPKAKPDDDLDLSV